MIMESPAKAEWYRQHFLRSEANVLSIEFAFSEADKDCMRLSEITFRIMACKWATFVSEYECRFCWHHYFIASNNSVMSGSTHKALSTLSSPPSPRIFSQWLHRPKYRSERILFRWLAGLYRNADNISVEMLFALSILICWRRLLCSCH